MKKIIIGCFFLAALAAAIGFGMKYFSSNTQEAVSTKVTQEGKALFVDDKIPGAVPECINLIPGNTDFVLKLGAVENIYKQFSITENSVFGTPVDNLEKIKNGLGFNPLVLEDLENAGVDTAREFGIVFNNLKTDSQNIDNKQADMFIFLPVNDAQKLKNAVTRLIKTEYPGIETSLQDRLTMFSEPGTKEKFSLIEKKDYLFIGINSNTDSDAYINTLISEANRLPETAGFQNTVSKINPSKDMFIYANIKNIIENNLEAIKENLRKTAKPGAPDISRSVDYLKDIESMGTSMDFSGKDFILKGVLELIGGSRTAEIMKNFKYDKSLILGIPDDPLLLASWGVHTQSCYNSVLDSMSEEDMQDFNAFQAQSGNEYGIDFKKDIIDNLSGSINLGIYDGMSINMMNYNMVLTATIKDENLFHNTLEKIMLKGPPHIQAMIRQANIGETKTWIVSVFGMVNVFISTKNGNLVASASKSMMEKALAGDVSKGFVSRIQDKNLADRISSDSGMLYLNFEEFGKALSNFSAMSAMMNKGKTRNKEKLVEKFEYLLSTAEIKGNNADLRLFIKTRFEEPFLQGMHKLKAMQDQPETR